MTDLTHLTHWDKILFSHEELACPETGEVRLDSAFAEELVKLRVAFDRPMVVTSCCRSAAYNKKIRGHPRSLHCYDEPYHPVTGTCAIDVSATVGTYRRDLVALALELGWSVGVATNFVHCDFRQAAGLVPVLYGYGR